MYLLPRRPSWRSALLGTLAALVSGSVAAQQLQAGPSTIEAVESRIAAGGFPNTSGNPFKRRTVTTFRVLHKGQPVLPAGSDDRRGAPWWDARVLANAPQPALLLMGMGAVLLTERNGQPVLQELAPPDSRRTQWQWLDSAQGQPGAVTVTAVAHRPDEPRELAGGRWLLVYAQTVLDVKTLVSHRFTLNSTEVLDQLQRFYAAETPALGFSPGGTQIVFLGSRDRPGESDMSRRFEHALVAFDFARQRGTTLPLDLMAWRLAGTKDVDTAFVQRALAWQRGADGRELATLRPAQPGPWLGRIEGRQMDSWSYVLQPARPSMQDALTQLLQAEFKAVVTPRAEGSASVDVRIGELTLSMGFLRPQEPRLALFYASDWQRRKEAHALIERIAQHVNARLAAGELQQHFVGAAADTAEASARKPR